MQIRAHGAGRVGLGLNLTEPDRAGIFQSWYSPSLLIPDSTTQTYLLPVVSPRGGVFDGPWRQLGLFFSVAEPTTIDIRSVSVIPKEAAFASAPLSTTMEARDDKFRRALYVHAPARLEYRVRVPPQGRLDFALGVVRGDRPISFRVDAATPGGEATVLLDETYADAQRWADRHVDLTNFAGRVVTLGLEVQAEAPGAVAMWAAPTVSGAPVGDRPNVIFYVIDGGAADYMSAYGYNRRTTPNLERLASQGALFEYAYSNSGWTRPSTVSFMTSLQHSVLGGLKNGFNVVPDNAQTMAQHMHRAGYQTAVLTSNANAGRLSGLDRGVDLIREAGVERDFVSSVELHDDFWNWRNAYPGQPYWVHFQTTDVHEFEGGQPEPVVPFTGLFVTAETRKSYYEDWDLVQDFWRRNPPSWPPASWYGGEFEATGIDRVGFFETMRSLYDESMAHQDYQIGRLVERLKAAGEWENTLLIVAADHSVAAALWDLSALLQDSLPAEWNFPMLRPTITRVPLIIVWPGHIQGGQRFDTPVSMIDVMPTLLELVGLPPPDKVQGRSLAPALLGLGDLEPRPVILDEFTVDDATGELQGVIEVIDGRWGASLEIRFEEQEVAVMRRPWPLLLYDLWNDPLVLDPVNERYPELVEKYTAFLEAQFEAHQALAQLFTPSASVALTPEQLETLRALGYIQ